MRLRNGGFTLLEVMVSMAILALSVTTLLIIRNNAIQQAAYGIETRKLKMLLEEKAGECALGFIKESTYGHFQDEKVKEYIWEAKVEPKEIHSEPDAFKKIYTVNLKKIKLSVRHEKADTSRALSVEMYIFNEPPEDASEEDTKKPK